MSDKVAMTIARMVETVEHKESAIGVLSTGERIAVALVLDRKDLLDRSMLEAVERLGPDWFKAALSVQRSRD